MLIRKSTFFILCFLNNTDSIQALIPDTLLGFTR